MLEPSGDEERVTTEHSEHDLTVDDTHAEDPLVKVDLCGQRSHAGRDLLESDDGADHSEVSEDGEDASTPRVLEKSDASAHEVTTSAGQTGSTPAGQRPQAGRDTAEVADGAKITKTRPSWARISPRPPDVSPQEYKRTSIAERLECINQRNRQLGLPVG